MTAYTREEERIGMPHRKPTSHYWIDVALLAPGCGFLFLAMAVPISQLVLASIGLFGLGSTTDFTLDNYLKVFDDVLLRSGFLFSLRIAFATMVCSVVAATILTALLQIEFPGRQLVSVLYKIPLVVPSLVAAFLVLTMIGPGGMAARLLAPLNVHWPSFVHDPSGIGIIIVLLWHNIPITVLIVSAVAAAIPRDVVEAARNLGASPWQVFGHVIVPLCVPGISAAALLVFIDSFGTFAIPSLIGPAFPRAISVMMTTEFLLHANWGVASALGVVMIVTTAIVLVLYYRLLTRMREQAPP
jgi:putative spermidine/putrescine transport system permease protein